MNTTLSRGKINTVNKIIDVIYYVSIIILIGVIILLVNTFIIKPTKVPTYIGTNIKNSIEVINSNNLFYKFYNNYISVKFKPYSNISENLEEKDNIINNLGINVPNKQKKYFETNLKKLPLSVLQLLMKENVKFDFSKPSPKDEKFITLGEYKNNKIFIYNEDTDCSSINHEIGHFVETYLLKNKDSKILNRISNKMLQESKKITCDKFRIEYMNINTNEFFAEGFSQYFDGNLKNCPIIKEYYDFYLNIIKE